MANDRDERAAPVTRRLLWMDLMRGTAILLVLLHHAMQVSLRHLDGMPVGTEMVDTALTPLRMPTMVFLSGMLLAASVRKPPRQYFGGKLRNIGYPFVVWTVIYMVVLDRAWYQDGTGGALTLGTHLLTAPSPLWFLLFLLLFYVAAFALRRLPHAPVVVISLLLSLPFAEDTRPARFFYLFAFFMLGDWVTSQADRWERLLHDRRVLALCGVLTAGLLTVALLHPDMPRYGAAYAVGVVAAVVLLARAARAVDGASWARPLHHLGRHSLIPYVVHYPVMVFVAAGLARTLEVGSPYVVLTATLLGGLGASVVAIALRARLPLVAALFALPRRDPPRGTRISPVDAVRAG